MGENLNRLLVKALPSSVVEICGSRYIAGRSLSEGIEHMQKNWEKYRRKSTFDIIIESVKDKDKADYVLEQYLEAQNLINKLPVMRGLTYAQMPFSTSVKPSSICVVKPEDPSYFDPSTPLNARLDRLVQNSKGIPITLDMENRPFHEVSYNTVWRQRQQGVDTFGIVAQSGYYHTEEFLGRFLEARNPHQGRQRVRLCRGIYRESREIATPDKAIAKNLLYELQDLLFERDAYVEYATHDIPLIQRIMDYLEQKRISKNRFQFSFLTGVPQVQEEIIPFLDSKGITTEMYVGVELNPGDALPYETRRLIESPDTLISGIKNIFYPVTKLFKKKRLI